jgi:hypothetical protein
LLVRVCITRERSIAIAFQPNPQFLMESGPCPLERAIAKLDG